MVPRERLELSSSCGRRILPRTTLGSGYPKSHVVWGKSLLHKWCRGRDSNSQALAGGGFYPEPHWVLGTPNPTWFGVSPSCINGAAGETRTLKPLRAEDFTQNHIGFWVPQIPRGLG